jgi:cobalt-zinc-cadmium efflux system protein
VLAALCNATFLLVSVGAIAWSAVMRLMVPTAVAAQTVIWVSLLGIAINTGTALMFMSGRKGDLNIRGAFMHMAADALISAGVVVAGVIILFTHWFWLDPAVSLVLALVIAFGTWELLRDSTNLALDAVPPGIDTARVREYLLQLPAVCDIHHLHIWGLSTTEAALTVHVVITDYEQCEPLLLEITRKLRDRFRIGHATVQFETVSQQDCAARDC